MGASRVQSGDQPTLADMSAFDSSLFEMRLKRSHTDLFEPLGRLYGEQAGYAAFADHLVELLRKRFAERPEALKLRDLERDLNPDWFLSQEMVGYVFYIDLFSGTLKGVLEHIDYLKSLGVTYVHFMPCLKPRPGDSDGGYSVVDYRAINPALGTMADFEEVSAALREEGISTCVDLVLNHTAKEHEWAQKARAGDAHYQAYYRMFDSNEVPLQYEETLLEIFPAHAPGNFTYYPDLGKWVWTTFNEHQWDLNWENPEVFLEIVDIMLHLGNRGAEVLRLDAVAFMWKELGTVCQNLPQVHDILQALRAATRIAAPAIIHKEEAIVAPDKLVPYLGVGRHRGKEGNLAYHNSLMVQYWSSLAAQDTLLMSQTLAKHFPESFRNASLATYIRCHDDIGWAITDEDAAAVPNIDAYHHRQFLADFYKGTFPGSFARGAVFQENPETGDRRSSGSFASLAGLETALEAGDDVAVGLAVSRILMGNALIASFGGVPLLYMGDELGLLNDETYLKDPARAHDNRWMHRPKMDWALAGRAEKGEGIAGRLLAGVRHIMAQRRANKELAATVPTHIVTLSNRAVFAFSRPGDERTLGCLFNFTAHTQPVDLGPLHDAGLYGTHDFLGDRTPDLRGGILYLAPYEAVWLG
ncbi:MAG: amylosucrase [Hyphomicrobiaceae bacterium]|nr:amylosucrase [Hyphomicrobiaceae bacterium]